MKNSKLGFKSTSIRNLTSTEIESVAGAGCDILSRIKGCTDCQPTKMKTCAKSCGGGSCGSCHNKCSKGGGC